MSFLLRFKTVIFLFSLLCPLNASEIYLGLTKHGQRADIGFAGFMPMKPDIEESKLSRQLQSIFKTDLLFARYFDILEGGPSYTGKNEELNIWRQIGAEIIISGKVGLEGNNITLDGMIIDVNTGSKIWEKRVSGSLDNYRDVAHELSDEVIMRIAGENGIARTKIAFVNDQTGKKEIFIIDYDGANLKQITFDRSINILPRWSPDSSEIVYTTYRYGNPDLYIHSFKTGKVYPLSKRQGLNTTCCFSPDGDKLVVTLSLGKYPNLFLLNRSGGIIRQLTFGDSISTSPSFAPNGREIVYISDSPGMPQLFIMNIEGGNVRRLPIRGFCDSPSWSPRGDKIAFSMRRGRDDNRYNIYIYDFSTGKISQITYQEGNNESPSWSPDGRFIVFSSTRSGKTELYIVAYDGSGLRKIGNIAGNSYSPQWSPTFIHYR